MAAETRGIRCPEGQWTALSQGKKKLRAVVRGSGVGKVITAAVLGSDGLPLAPPVGDPGEDYSTLSPSKPYVVNFDDNGTNVFVWPAAGPMVVEVTREGDPPPLPGSGPSLKFSNPSNSQYIGQVI